MSSDKSLKDVLEEIFKNIPETNLKAKELKDSIEKLLKAVEENKNVKKIRS